MTPEFERAVGGMADIPQWFVWRLVWVPEEGKYDKTPCALDGMGGNIDAGLPANWRDYDTVRDAVLRLNAAGGTYAMGFRLTADCGYWFLDLDRAVDDHGGVLPFASQLVAAYPGAMVEWSSSRKGLHVIGMGAAPEGHRTRPERDVAARLLPLQLEFYTKGRGIAFGLDGTANGCADTRFDVAPLVASYFPPRVAGSAVHGDWRGPADDDVLIERMLAARMSAEAAFGGKASLRQLWEGSVEHNSNNDMALASHLAFWTGCDEERIERLMWRSGMVRDKWRVHRTYLALTIGNAIASCDNVYQEPERNLAVQGALYAAPGQQQLPPVTTTTVERISADTFNMVQLLLDEVAGCGDELTLHNEVIPHIQQAGVPMALQERLVSAVRARLALWDNKMGVGKLRALLFPPALRAAPDAVELPEWAQSYAFVSSTDQFFDTYRGTYMSMTGFQAVYGRFMPLSDAGRRENAAEKCLHFWNMPIVHRVGYRPDCGPFFEWSGVSYANEYSPASLPGVASAYSVEGLRGIEAFKQQMWDMCGHRKEVYDNLLYWFAHNVQYPGRKIRWSPIVKGVHGDGKTLIIMVLRAAMGFRNVNETSNATLANSGGFTDWAVRGAVNVIEEIMLTGKQRHQIYNATKVFITNDVVDINPKGRPSYQTFNTTNHYANTNHNDALPMEPTDRRWFVVFTPWSTLEGMMRYCGIDADGWRLRTDSMDYAWKNCANELRAWFLSIPIPNTFDINGSAMMTPEKRRMMASGQDDAESVALSLIVNGSVGITEDVFSSNCLTRIMQIKAQIDNFEIPRSSNLNHMLTRLGYSKLEKQFKWNNQAHTIWLKNGIELSNEEIRLKLEATTQPSTQPSTQAKPL